MFPTSIKGVLPVDESKPADKNRLIYDLGNALEQVDARAVKLLGDSITFKGGIFRLTHGDNVLVPITSGVIQVRIGEPGFIRYKFSCLQMLSIFALVLVGRTLDRGNGGVPVSEFIAEAGVWSSAYALVYAIAAYRLRALIRRVVANLNG